MGAEPSIALVFSPDPWVEQLHRFVADHGGARIRQLVVDPAVLDDEEFDVLVTGDRWPSLTTALVERLHTRRVLLCGVFDPDEPAGKDHLLALRVDTVVAGDAPPAEIVALIGELVVHRRGMHCVGADERHADRDAPVREAAPPVVVTGAAGSGATEVGLALGVELARRSPTLLLDARLGGAGTSVRLGLPMSPNLRTAVDDLLCGSDPADCVLTLARSGLHVLTGFPNAASAGQVTPREVLDVVDALRPAFSRLVLLADGGVLSACTADGTVVMIAAPTPLGVARVTGALADLASATGPSRHVVVNRAPRDRFRVAELRSAIGSIAGVSSVHVLPDDPHVGDAAWDGVVVGECPFTRAVTPLAALLAGDPGRRRHRPGRRARGRGVAGGAA